MKNLLLCLSLLLVGTVATLQPQSGRIYLPLVQHVPVARTTLVSRHTNGTQGNNSSLSVSISADGRYIVFNSLANNLVDGDTNGEGDAFIHDRQTGETALISRLSSRASSAGTSVESTISTNGRFIAFAGDLTAAGNGAYSEVYVLDRQTGQVGLVSRHSNGTPGNISSSWPSLSADGRYVAFQSSATNLVDNDTNRFLEDIFIHDRETGQTTLISRHSDGTQGNDYSTQPAISADGRFIVFMSMADNLVAGDTNDASDVFVHDRLTSQTTLVSHHSDGVQGNEDSWEASISADGRYIAFHSSADNLVDDDNQLCDGGLRTCLDIFLHDRLTGQTTLVSRHTNGEHANHASFDLAISANGRFIAFTSRATNLVDGDANGEMDVFVHDRETGRTSLITNFTDTSPLIWDFNGLALSADGRFVVFSTNFPGLVPGDINGYTDVFVYDRGW